jgi:hypothetical protein
MYPKLIGIETTFFYCFSAWKIVKKNFLALQVELELKELETPLNEKEKNVLFYLDYIIFLFEECLPYLL